MILEDALYTRLTTYAPLTALVGSRVYAMTLTENATLPAVTYQRISTVPLRHRGTGGPVGTLDRARYQIDGWAAKASAANQLRIQIRACMTLWQQSGGPRVDVVFLEDDRDLREPASGRYRASLDFMLFATQE